MVGFEELATGQDHVALVYGDISGQSPVWPAYIQSV
jgi:GTP cyclohydrolase II